MSLLANLNDHLSWSEWDIVELKWEIAHGNSIEKIATFLCRSSEPVRAKAIELGLIDDALAPHHDPYPVDHA